MNKTPTFMKMLLNDYLLFLMLTGSVILIGLGIYIYFGEKETSIALGFIGFGLFCGIIAILRVQTLKKLFSTGLEADGVITRVYFFRDRGRAEFAFVYEGVEYRSGSALMKNSKTRVLETDMPVKIIFNPQKVRQAAIKDIYF